MSLTIRPAVLDDAGAISAAFCAQIDIWQRIGGDGRVETVPHDLLTIYQRWLHGGAWMSIETASVWLNHLLLGAGLARVALNASGIIVGYAEAFVGNEPEPFGRVLHIHHLLAGSPAVRRALLAQLAQDTRALRCQRLTVARIGGDNPYADFADLAPIALLRRYSISARQGQVFFRAVDHPNSDAAQIAGWAMPIGRVASARTGWEMLYTRMFDSIAEIAARKTQRLYLSVAGQEAYLHIQQGMYDPRMAEVAVWSPKPLSVQVVSAVRDWAYREGYRSLLMTVHDDDRPALGPDAEADGYTQETCSVTAREAGVS
ncbi:MAG: hypothetical protein JNL42_03245 [Anaerolineae bacterium]|nr:hypothetical protein [Anaerolineae bacterium]